MSAVEILAELPKLTSEERSVVRRRLRELDERDELQFLHDSADAMFQDLDKLEADPCPPQNPVKSGSWIWAWPPKSAPA